MLHDIILFIMRIFGIGVALPLAFVDEAKLDLLAMASFLVFDLFAFGEGLPVL